jgi:hypothetical protein
MKKLFVLLTLVLAVSGIASAIDDQLYLPYGDYATSSTDAQNYAVSVSSIGFSTVTAVMNGGQRTIVNNGTATVYITKMWSASVTTIGIPLLATEKYIESVWFGAMYIQTIAGSAAQDVRVETLKKKN